MKLTEILETLLEREMVAQTIETHYGPGVSFTEWELYERTELLWELWELRGTLSSCLDSLVTRGMLDKVAEGTYVIPERGL